MASPFDYVKAINETKQNLLLSEPDCSGYSAFTINRTLSYDMATILYANEMNIFYNLPNDMQFLYLLNSIPKAKRFCKWSKPDEQTKSLSLVKEYYKYSDEKARQALEVLSDDDLAIIETRLFKGGR